MIFRIIFEFFKIGLFSVGGGLATIPFLTKLSENTAWFTLAELADMVAVAESTPGPIGVNVATYVGFKIMGIPGAVIATLSLVAPSFLIILVVSTILDKFRNSKEVDALFYGLRPASMGLITSALYSLCIMSFLGLGMLDIRMVILAVILFVATNYIPKIKKLHPIVFIIFAAIVGVIFKF